MFKVGDTVKVEAVGTVVETSEGSTIIQVDVERTGALLWIPESHCTLIEPPLKVGDWVTCYGDRGEITAIGRNSVLYLGSMGRECRALISDLTRIEKP